MEDRVKQFLESGKLEEYVYGLLDPKDEQDVLAYIKKYPEVKEEYDVLQDQLETLSVKQSMKAPVGMKAQIMDALPDKNIPVSSAKSPWSTYLAVLGLVSTLLLAWAWKNANDQLAQEKVNYATLASDCEEKSKYAEEQAELIAFYNSQQTQRYDLQGNQLAPDFNAMVFVNDALGKAILKPTNKIQLPKSKCLQLWGDLDGEMIPIAVLDDAARSDYELEINPAFTSLNLTIEEKTADGKGQDHPDVSQLISSVVM